MKYFDVIDGSSNCASLRFTFDARAMMRHVDLNRPHYPCQPNIASSTEPSEQYFRLMALLKIMRRENNDGADIHL